MGKRKSPEEIADLVQLPIHEYQRKYNEPNRNKVTTLKRYYLNKLRSRNMEQSPESNPEITAPSERLNIIAELLERSGIDINNIQKVNSVKLYQSARGTEDDGWSVQDLVSVDFTPKVDQESAFQAEAANIRPTKRKAPKRDYKLMLVYGDGQVGYRRIIDAQTGEMELVPIHDENIHNIYKELNAEYQPDYTINLGDFADMSEVSRFDPTDDHFHKTLAPSMQYIHDFYAQLVADNPNGTHIEVDSNHAVRPKKQILKNIPGMYDFYRPGEEYPYFTYYSMANLGKLGIQFISGYGNAEYVHGEEYGRPIIFKHGIHSSSSPGATVRKEAQQNPETHVIRGHGHNHETIMQTTRNGDQLFYYQIGSSCKNDSSVPGYSTSIDDFNRPVEKQIRGHQNTFLMIEDYENGHYNISTLNVIRGIVNYRGKQYGNERE